MTATHDVWKITTVTDAALARAALDRTVTDGQPPTLERARFLSDLSARLRHCLSQGGEWELVRCLRNDTAAQGSRLEVSLRPIDASAADPEGEPALVCPLPHLRHPTPLPPLDRDVAGPLLPEALLRADAHTATALDLLEEQQCLVRLHREELHHTNQGVLALHSELEATARAQRDLLEAERAARDETERARRLLTFLADASATIAVSLSPEAIVRRVSDLLVPDYAEHIDVWLFDEDDEPGHRRREHAAAAVTAARTDRPQHAGPHPGRLPGVDDLPPSALSPDRPLLAIPFGPHRLLGVLTLTAPGPRFDADTCIMLIELARRAGIALDHARRYEQYRDTAESLQRAQLTDLPAVPGLQLAARYLPATRGMNIGGDWYDAFLQPDGSLLTVIGDVTGHGLHAAIVMGQLRTALRAYAIDNATPGAILTLLHRMLRHLQPELYATALIARVSPGKREAVWASAGHPPAIVCSDDGGVSVLRDRPGPMLGIPLDCVYADHTTALPPGGTLMLYTDGLVERRALGIDPGIERLADALGALPAPETEQDLDAAADTVVTRLLHDSARDDDVCLLLCHVPARRQEDETHTDPAGRSEPA
ncbi:GAF domain-containing SpoIIE family protein phosphatase [Streptomyces sp. JB150]|uniref:PP2C family protein-serine/threonine phosphatase n=1 Tax=Streptomyces sp. JB150 TaxID=2714844 RepID=UPI001408958B|nr:GAF domain-containing SpoIIE family protein phosphatase [Streptomyces sp. JB150]QIJ61217.1 SpoIIE family protein phosphatase [Streptomyces sp. JB150]